MKTFRSICSGIEAASVAFAPLGWKAAGFSEIEPFPCAVLAEYESGEYEGSVEVALRQFQCPDGPRYKALGNSWAVNCARWIGRRIELVEKGDMT